MEAFSYLKTKLVSRMFWGRGSLYRTSFHLVMFSLTAFAITTGVISELLAANTGQQILSQSFAQGGTYDLAQQGTSIQTVLSADPFAPDVRINRHIVKSGETLKDIAKKYEVTMDTIRWANRHLISPFSEKIQVGWKLRIPQMNGVLHVAQAGDTVDSLAKRYGGHRLDIIELNDLSAPKYKIRSGQEIFIPHGEVSVSEVIQTGIPQGVFSNPLSHPKCKGYRYMRGFTGYHKGIDLAKGGGCPIRAIATGKVIYAGWSSMAGFNVVIDHGGGITSKYFHGNGTFWVKKGDRVQQGQDIMYMGSSGNSTGTHLHISLTKNGIAVNPAPFVPF